MKSLLTILLIFFTLPLTSFKEKKGLETEKYLNFLSAIENTSTFSYFTVIKVKDLNTGVTKEICAKGSFVSGALYRELNANYDEKGNEKVEQFVKKRKNRYFEFKDKTALENISFYEYNLKQLKKVQEKYDFGKVVRIIEKDKKLVIPLSDKEMKYFAHVLFNKGYMTGESDCFGGRLEFVDRTKTRY
jgi:hypothetical protein